MVFKELQLQTSGIKIEVFVISVSIRGFICEAPTRSFLKCVTGHNEYYACEQYDGDGNYYEKTIVFNIDEEKAQFLKV